MSKKLKKNIPVLRFPEFEGDLETTTLEKVSIFYDKQRIPLSSEERQIRQGDYPYYGASGIIDYIDDYIFDGTYILLAEDGANILNRSTPIAFIAEGKFWVNNHAHILQAIGSNHFLAEYLENLSYDRYNTGTAQPKLNADVCKKIIIKIPGFAEQEKIASFLGAVDRRLTQLRRKQELLQTYKRGVMQKIFSQEIRFKGAIGSPLPDWERKKLGDIAINGFSNGVFNDPNKVGKGYRLINVKDMYEGDYINVETLSRLLIDEKEFVKNQAKYGDIFFTRSSLVKEGIAHSNVLLTNDSDITYDSHLIRFRFDIEENNPQFMAFILKSSIAKKQLVARGKTGTMTTIGQEDISTVKIPIPDKQEQEKIANFLTAINCKIEALSRQIYQTEKFKKGLLQKLFI